MGSVTVDVHVDGATSNRMVTTSLDDSAQRHLFHATSPRYPPADEEEQDLPLPEGIQVTEGADGKKGSGCYLLGRREK